MVCSYNKNKNMFVSFELTSLLTPHTKSTKHRPTYRFVFVLQKTINSSVMGLLYSLLILQEKKNE